ncbi:MAG: hypothetical protein E7645_00150 [Ruminococcaceae bacterium]|nr:hypothetical protein [Oscillospiraceae bacterium]
METATKVSAVGEEKKSPAVELATELYKNITMGSDAIIHLLPKVKDNGMKTSMTASMCYYEKAAGKVKAFLKEHGAEAKEEPLMTRMASRMGIVMNTALDATSSHIAQMLIEGSTMAITEATRLCHRFERQAGCEEMLTVAKELAEFEQAHIEKLKSFL